MSQIFVILVHFLPKKETNQGNHQKDHIILATSRGILADFWVFRFQHFLSTRNALKVHALQTHPCNENRGFPV